mgnify:CR=1 FL=1
MDLFAGAAFGERTSHAACPLILNESTGFFTCATLGDASALLWASGMNIDAIAIGRNPPDELNVIVEVPLGGEPIKYEMEKASGALFVDRFLYTPMRYPGNYGFIPHTLCGDGDPLDVLIMNSRPVVPGCVVSVRPFGVTSAKPPRTKNFCTAPAMSFTSTTPGFSVLISGA